MGEKARRVIRQMECPEGRGKTSVLIDWRVDKGKKVLNSVSCNNPLLMDYSGHDCQWLCWERISRGKK